MSVDGKQHLSEVVFSRILIVRKITGSGSYPYTQDSSPVTMGFKQSGHCLWSPDYPVSSMFSRNDLVVAPAQLLV